MVRVNEKDLIFPAYLIFATRSCEKINVGVLFQEFFLI